MNRIINSLGSPRRNTRDLSQNILITLLLAVVFSLINHNFVSQYNMISIAQNLAPYAMLSLGVLLPISMGGTDLSVGAVCIGSAVVAGKFYSLGAPLWCTIPIMLVFASLIGLINGYLIAKKHIQPFIATLGTMMFVRGAAAIFANQATVLFPSGSWYNNLFSSYHDIPMGFFWVIIFALVLYFIYRKTKFGRYLISIGSCEKATRISGVDVDKYKILGYIGSAFMAGVAAVFWTSSFATVAVATGNGMELDAIAGVYIGGTSAAGGLANVFGSVIGSFMLVIIRSGLNFALAKLNIPINSTFVTYVISGIIVIVSVLIENQKGGTSRKSKKPTIQKNAIKRFVSYIISLILLGSLIVMGISFAKESSNQSKSSETKKICLAMKSEGNDYWDLFVDGAQKAGKELGYEVICRGTEGEDASYLPRAIEIANTLISENPSGFGIATIANGFTDILQEAYTRGIPVVEFDNGLQADDYATIISSASNPLRSHIVASNYNNGALGGEKAFYAVRDEIIAADKYVVGIIQYSTIDAASERANGFKDRFEELAENDPETAGKTEVIIEVKPSDNNNAYKDALEFLFEKKARLIFLSSLYVCNQVADAVQSSGSKYDGVKFVGFDAGEKPNEWLNTASSHPLIGIVTQNPYMIGYETVQTLVAIDNGSEVEEKIVISGEWVTADSNN